MAIYSKMYFRLHPSLLVTSPSSPEGMAKVQTGWIATFGFVLHKTIALIISLSPPEVSGNEHTPSHGQRLRHLCTYRDEIKAKRKT